MKKIIAIVFILTGALWLTLPSLAQTVQPSTPAILQIIQRMLLQIQQLQEQIRELQRRAVPPAAAPQPAPTLEAPAPAPVEPIQTVSFGARKNSEVNKLQKFLIDNGYLKITAPTGFYLNLTREAVRKLQVDNELPPTGNADEETLKLINQKRGVRVVIPGLIEEGAGQSGRIPPGLLIAPGLGLATTTGTTTPPFGTTTPPVPPPPPPATSTPPSATTTPPAAPPPSVTPPGAPPPPPSTGTTTPPSEPPPPPPPPPGPTSFSFNAPANASVGGYATLTWTTSGYSSCYAGVNRGDVTILGWLGVKPLSGSQSIGPLNYQNVDVQFTCIGGSSGDISSSKVITVSGGITNPWSNIGSFTVTNHPLEPNSCCTYLVQANVSINVSWSGNSPTGCKLNLQTPENGSTLTSLATGLPASGSYSIPAGVSQNSKIWLTCGGIDSNRLLKVSGSAPTPPPPPPPSGNVPAAPGLSAYLYAFGVVVNFTWSDNSNNETGFTLYTRLLGTSTWRRVTQSDFPANSTQMAVTDYNATPGTHEYMLVAVNYYGQSPYSNIVPITFTASSFAATPTNLTASASGSSVTLNWTDNANNETAYRVYQLTLDGNFLGQVGSDLAPNSTSFVHAGVSPGTYKYRVNACTSSGCSLSSNQPTIAVGAPPPPTPTPTPPPSNQVQGLTATVSGNSVTLSWTVVTTATIGVYNIYRTAFPNFTADYQLLIAQGNFLSYTHTNVPAGTSYYKVAAQDVNGTIYPPSNEISINVTAPPLQAPAPQYNYWGVGGSAPSYEGLYMLDNRFTYPGTMAGVGFGFRFYHKRPGETNFSAVATFTNPAPIAQNCSSGVSSGNWTLEYSCPYSLWFLRHTTQPSSFFPVGTYESYLVAFDASGEGPPSATFTHVALDRTTILSPIGAQASSTTPIIRWTVASGWPSNPSYYIKVYDNTSVVWNPNVSVTAGSTEGSVVYAGSALDPIKTYTVYIRSSLVSGGINYISMNAGTQSFTASTSSAFLPTSTGANLAAQISSIRNQLAAILEILLQFLEQLRLTL